MDLIIIGKFYQQQPFIPIRLVVVNEQLEIMFNLLVYIFHLSIGLRMVGRGHEELDTEDSVCLRPEDGGELRVSVGHDRRGEPM